MLKEFVSLGQWWLPNNPEIIVPGKLSFSPESGAKLDLIGSFYSSHFEEIDQIEEIIILGLLDNNEEITLYDCECVEMLPRLDSEKCTQNFLFSVKYIFRKIHFENEKDIKLKSISVRYSYMEQWVGKSGLQISFPTEENKILISYQPPQNISLTKIGDLNLEITFSPIPPGPLYFCLGEKYYKANIEQKTYLTLQNSCDQSLDSCIKILLSFRDLLSFAMTRATSIIEITGKEELKQTPVIIMPHLGLWNSAKNSEVGLFSNEVLFLNKMLFLFSDVENNLGQIFDAWNNKEEVYESVFELLMITIYTPNLYSHYKFLNIVQALEAYHTSKYEGLYQDKKVYEKGLCAQFLEVLKNFPSESVDHENGISNEFRNALKGKLKYQTRFTLETRLKEILTSLFPLLPENFIGSTEDRKAFAHRVSETRNALTHHDKEKRNKAAQGKELSRLFYTLTVILQVCLLKELDFTDDSIKVILERNRSYKNEWRSSSN